MSSLEFVSSLSSSGTHRARVPKRDSSPTASEHHHAVQFYEDGAFISGAVAEFLSRGLVKNEAAIAIATAPHAAAIINALEVRGINVPAARESGRFLLLDAHETLAEFMRDGQADGERFTQTIERAIFSAAGSGDTRSLRAYGEMVDVLWRDGNIDAALHLEDLWNDLLEKHGLSLLCAYSVTSFYHPSSLPSLHEVCSRHTKVIPLETAGAQPEPMRATLIELQRRESELREALARERVARMDAERAQEEALRARMVAEQANRAKSEFLAVMSHELRTPLNAIGGYAELMELGLQGPVSTDQREALDRIQRSQRMLLGLINEVLNYTRIETGTVQFDVARLSVDELLRATEGLLAPQMRARNLRYDYSGCAPDVYVRADAEKLQQIVLNLLTNAMKFTDGGGSVRLAVEASDSEVLIRVYDTGIGIAADKLERIFEPFVQVDANYTRTRDGVGLGLSISRDLARGMGGDILVESEPGRGSIFTVVFDRA